MYYISKALLLAKARYPDMEKLALFFITVSRKLRPYFQVNSIEILTNFPLKKVLQKIDASSHLLKWAIEVSEFDLLFKSRSAIKEQALAEFTKVLEMEATMEPAKPPTWNLFVDGSLGKIGSWAGVVLESLKDHKLDCTIRFCFKASNNVIEYEDFLVDD